MTNVHRILLEFILLSFLHLAGLFYPRTGFFVNPFASDEKLKQCDLVDGRNDILLV